MTPASTSRSRRRWYSAQLWNVSGIPVRGMPSKTLIYADEMWESDEWMDRALESLPDPVYLTFDVDYFDPSLMPSTGTPEPGGGDWYRTLSFLKRVFRERTVAARAAAA